MVSWMLALSLVFVVGCQKRDWVRSVDGPGGSIALPFHELTPSKVEGQGDADGDILWVEIESAPYRELRQPALLLNRASSNVVIQLDDNWIFGSFEPRPMRHTWNTPLLIALPSDTLARADRLRIGLFSFLGDHRILEPFAVGEYADLQPIYRLRHLFQVNVAFGTSLVMGAFAGLFLVLWLASGREAIYLLASLSLAAFVLSNLNYHVSYQPLKHDAWRSLAHASVDWCAMLWALWMLEMKGTGLRMRWQHGLLGWAGACTALNLLLPAGSAVPYVEWAHSMTLVLFLLVAAGVFAGRQSTVDDRLTFAVGAAVTGAMGASDIAVQAGVLDGHSWPRMAPYFGFVFAATSATWLLRRFGRTFAVARRNNEQLQALVHRRETELRVEHAALLQAKAALARSEERGAMVRELHDGMGGQLVSALALSERVAAGTAVPEALRDALREMRTLIQAPVPLEPADLGTLLGSQREKFERQLGRAAMTLAWNVDPTAEFLMLEPAVQVHVTRVVQECIANAIKHSGGRRVTLSLSATDEATLLTVSDDGVAGGRAPVEGRGLKNIAERARAVGASCSYESNKGGTSVRLRWGQPTRSSYRTAPEQAVCPPSSPDAALT